MRLLLSFAISLLFVTALNANCGKNGNTKDGKCGMQNTQMSKQKCDMSNCKMKDSKTKESCNSGKCGAGKCGADMKKNTKYNYTNDAKCLYKDECNCSSKKDDLMCGCGMTKESCKKMMPYCKFRDGEKK